jgi:general secretion pathway protein G
MKKIMSRQQSGFTLIEVLVVVVIMAILAAIIVPRIMSRPEQARIVKAKTDVGSISNAMDMYKLDNGFYPSQDQGVKALVHKPAGDPAPDNWNGYLKRLPADPWGHDYHYMKPGHHGEIDIWSYGPTNKPGKGTIGNWLIK